MDLEDLENINEYNWSRAAENLWYYNFEKKAKKMKKYKLLVKRDKYLY